MALVARPHISNARCIGILHRQLESKTGFNAADTEAGVDMVDDLVMENTVPTLDSMADSLKTLADRMEQLLDGQKDLMTGQEDLKAGQEDLMAWQEDLMAGQEDLKRVRFCS